MEILVIGNGFDIAHGLPTKYEEFLDYVATFLNIYQNHNIRDNGGLNNTAKPQYASIDKLIFENSILADEFNEMIKDNKWIRYFSLRRDAIGDTWIDFEKEISAIICIFEMCSLEERFGSEFDTAALNMGYNPSVAKSGFNRFGSSTIVSDLERDLNRLIRALEIYISFYVNSLTIQTTDSLFETIYPDYVLSFNYSNTYERLYSTNLKNRVSYIHGKADMDNFYEAGKTNIVLGIDDALEDGDENEHLGFIPFKKYYQRIIKSTDNSYMMWCDSFANDWKTLSDDEKYLLQSYASRLDKDNLDVMGERVNCVRIFGHSLDVTDRDVLRRIICNDNTQTVLYYHNKDARERQVRNLVRVIGKDELLRRTGGITKTIFFVDQTEV